MNKYFLTTVALLALQASSNAAFSVRTKGFMQNFTKAAEKLQTGLQSPQAQIYFDGTRRLLFGSPSYKRTFAKQAVQSAGRSLLWGGGFAAFAGVFGRAHISNNDTIYMRPKTQESVNASCKQLTNAGMWAAGAGSMILFPRALLAGTILYGMYEHTRSAEEIKPLELSGPRR